MPTVSQTIFPFSSSPPYKSWQPINAGPGYTVTDYWDITADGDFFSRDTLTISSFTFSGFSYSIGGSIVSTDSSTVYVTATAINASSSFVYISFVGSNSSTGAYSSQVIPAVVKSVPRGSSNLVMPSTVITSPNFLGLNTVSNQIFSYEPGSSNTIYAQWTLNLTQSGNHPGSFAYVFYQQINSATGYMGFDVLDLKPFR